MAILDNVMISATLAIASAAFQSPLERLKAFAGHESGLSTDMSISFNNEKIKASIALRRPNFLALIAEFRNEKFEHRQSTSSTIQFDHTGREYFLYPQIPKFSAPAPDFPALEAAFPRILLDLVIDVKPPAFKESGKESVAGVTCDVLKYVSSQAGDPTITLWVDSLGRLVKSYMNTPSPQGNEVVTILYTNFFQNPSQDRFTADLPYGYVSSNNSPPARPLGVGYEAPFKTWVNVNGKSVDMAKTAKGKNVVLLFTSTDCKPSQAAMPSIKELATRLRQADATIYEVSLGAGKPKSARPWQTFSDENGSIGKAYGIPVTPYLLAIGEDGIILRGWAGYGSDQAKRLVEQMVSAFE